MNNINPVIFLIPLLALILAGILYFSLLKKATDKKAFNKFVFTITVLSFLQNFAWELIQVPLYFPSEYSVAHIAFCTLASLADVIMVLLLYFAFGFIFGNPFWIAHLNWKRSIIVIFVGGAGAVLAEARHLSLGTWAYADSMPIIPLINVGISPVLQFMILPLLIYFLSFYWLKIIRKNQTVNKYEMENIKKISL